MSERTPPASLTPLLLWGWVGGAAFGLVEVARVATAARLASGWVALAALAFVGLVATGMLGALGLAVLGWLPRVRRTGPVAWAVLGALSALWVRLAAGAAGDVTAFRGPGAVAWVSAGLAALALVAVVAGWPRAGRRQRVVAVVVLVAAAMAWVLLGAPPGAGARPADPVPNILLVTVDGARADRFRSQRPATAATERVIREGAWFARAWSPSPYTGPAHASLLTGSAPWEHGVLLDGQPLPADRPTLAEALREAGWDTGAFVSHHAVSGALGFRRGFSVYDDEVTWVKGWYRTTPGRLALLMRGGRGTLPATRRGDHTVDRALSWMRSRRGPWFAWVHLADPLPPFEPSPPWDSRYDPGPDAGGALITDVPARLVDAVGRRPDAARQEALYDGEIAWTDTQMGRLLDAVAAAGGTEHTVVVITAPHGMGLGVDAPWFSHGGLDAAGTHVPLAVRWPGTVPPGRVVEHPVELTDLAPTLAGWAGVEPPAAWTGLPLDAPLGDTMAARSVARGLAFDGEAIARDGERPWRMAAVHNRGGSYVRREAPDREDTFLPSDAGSESVVRGLLRERAGQILEAAPRDVVPPRLSPADRALLEGIGARVRPEE